MIPAGVLVATCPTHGERTFQRCDMCSWEYCPEPGCRSVIPHEWITPDGAEVIQWDHPGHGHCGNKEVS